MFDSNPKSTFDYSQTPLINPPSHQSKGVCSLPNELLYSIFTGLPTSTLLGLAPVSRRFHALVVRILHYRLGVAATLGGHHVVLESFHPSRKQDTPKLFCNSLGTLGLDTALDYEEGQEVGRLDYLNNLYSKFTLTRKEPERGAIRKHPAGDIPGSRTHPATAGNSTSTHQVGNGILVSETVSLDQGEWFSQLCTIVNMVKLGPRPGILLSIVETADGTIRVWRDWLMDKSNAGGGLSKPVDPREDESILWVNNSNKAVGIRFRVRERKFKKDTPILYASEEEVAVSYYLDFEELVVKTSLLLKSLEDSIQQQHVGTGKALVFGSIAT